MKAERKNEIYLIVVLLLVSAGVFFCISFLKQPGMSVVITLDGDIYAELELKEDTDLEIGNGEGGTNHLVISDGFASITEASCPDQLCVHQKKISLSGETLVCLPNKVVVEVIGDGSEQGDKSLDGVVN